MSASNVTQLLPTMRWTAADDAYTAWFNAHQRAGEALRVWNEAASEDRAAAYRAYVVELELEEMAAAELERVSSEPLAA